MNLSFQQNLQQVREYFAQGDQHLGFRRLLDAAISTENNSIFRETLSFADLYDQKPSEEKINTALGQLLEKLHNAGTPVVPNNNQPKIITEGLSKRYAGGPFQLSNITLSVHPGEIIGLVGENGNGKTTLLRLLGGDLLHDSGTIQYNFQDIDTNKVERYELRSRLAFVPQRHPVWYGGLMENLEFTAAHYGLKGETNILWTEIIVARLGLRAFREFTWSRISSGYKMRFELARTLLRRPEVMLLDEPLANLDVMAQQVILEDLRYLAQNPTRPMAVVLSSQQLYEVEKVSGKVVFLKEGKPQLQQTNRDGKVAEHDNTDGTLIIELETDANRNAVTDAMRELNLTNISYNGGVYLLYFESCELKDVLRALSNSQLNIRYLRDISHSSRRFFDN